jgi:type IV secretion system protein VirD4
MNLTRLILILALFILGYCLIVVALRFPWLAVSIAVILFLVNTRRGPPRLWAHGTARWAELADLRGMLDAETGLILGRPEYTQPGPLKAAANLFDRRLKAEAACGQSVMALRLFARRKFEGPLVRLPQAVHTAVFAPTGVGKGVSCIIPFLLDSRESVVVVDFKGDLFRITANARRAWGHRVIRLDPFGVCGPGSDTFNPLDSIDAESALAIDEARDLAAAMVVRTGMESEPHWNDSAEMWISAMLSAVALLTRPPNRSLQGVRTLLTNPVAMETAIRTMCASDACSGMLSRLGHQLRNYQNKELNSVPTTTNRHLNFLDTLPISENTRASSFDPSGLNRGMMTVYLVLPPDHMRKQSALLRLWIGSLLRAVVKGGLQETNKVHFVCDEAASLGHMDCLDDAVDKYRGYGVRLQFYYQSMGQLRESWPNGRDQTVLSNTTQIFFGVNDQQTAEYVSSRLGEETITVDSGGTNVGGEGDGTLIGPRGVAKTWGRSSNWSQLGRRLLRPEEVTALPPRVAITLSPGVPPIATTLTRYYERSGPGRFRRLYHKFEIAVAALAMLVLCAGLAWVVTASIHPHVAPNGSATRRGQGGDGWRTGSSSRASALTKSSRTSGKSWGP